MNFKLHLILFFIYSSLEFGVFGQDEEYFLPFIDSTSEENLVGYKNKDGDVVVPAKYQITFYSDTLWPLGDIRAHTSDVVAMRENDSIFFQPFICTTTQNYSNERLTRFEKSGKMGFFDDENKIVIPPKYDFVTPFKDGFAEFYQGVDKLYIQGCWYYGGDIQSKGYLNKEGKVYSKKTKKFYKNGTIHSVMYNLHNGNYDCKGELYEVIEYYESGTIKTHIAMGFTPACEEDFMSKYIFSKTGDTIHIENRKRGEGLNGEYRISHYDYYVDSLQNKIYDWYLIRSVFSNDSILDFINTDLVFLNERYQEISEKRMIKKINNKNLDWTYTYLPQNVWNKSGEVITFIIHPIKRTSKDRDLFDKAKAKILKHWISTEFNRIIYQSDSLSISLIDTTSLESNLAIKEIGLSPRKSKRIIKLLKSEASYDIGLLEIPNSSIKILSYNGEVRPTILWFSMQSGYIYIEKNHGKGFIRLKKSKKLTKKLNRVLKKNGLFE